MIATKMRKKNTQRERNKEECSKEGSKEEQKAGL